MVKTGFIGCGRISDLHYQAYRQLDEAEIAMICDPDEQVVRKKAELWGVGNYCTDFRDILKNPHIDAVEILTPQLFHEQLVIEALEAGKHVAVQKPMTVSLKSADRMIRAAEKNNRILKVTENYIFYPPILEARKRILEGQIGEPSTIRIKLSATNSGGWFVPPGSWQWRMEEFAQGRGSQTFDHGHHLWAVAWFLMGEFERVSAWIDVTDDSIDSPAVIMWKHRGERRYGSCEYSYSNEMEMPSDYYSNDEWIDITGSRGILRINRCTGHLSDRPVLGVYRDGKWEYPEESDSDWSSGFTGAARNFINAVQGREEPVLSLGDARHILAMDIAVQKAARKFRPVFVDELDAPLPGFYAWKERNRMKSRSPLNVKVPKDSGNPVRLEKIRRKFSSYASVAGNLTLSMGESLAGKENLNLRGVFLIELTGVNQTTDTYRLDIADRNISMDSATETGGWDVKISSDSGVWGAVLSGKKSMMTAYLQGLITIQGDSGKALSLKKVLEL
ncbi:MAG: Gfo/Idh/MocA family oxidoreductase [Spirochaetales bacterium]|nr:Gfo/Idh/MocA family oxidoreductase [Spirochaetales bacterium]